MVLCLFPVAHDDVLPHGASAFCEILTQLIQRVMQICREKNIEPPEHLVIQSDNTTSQAKNSLVGQYLATLVSRQKFLTCVLNFLTVGHTHEDVDQVFSVLLASVLHRHRFIVPSDLVALIQARMHVFAKCGEECHAFLLDHIFDFGSWLDPQGIHLHNCFVTRQGVDAPHSFLYKQRQDLTPREQAQLLARRVTMEPDCTDVFCVTKHFMHNTAPNGPPVLVLPRSRCDRLHAHGPEIACVKRRGMTADRRDELRMLASALEALSAEWRSQHSYFRAAHCLRELADWTPQGPAAHTWLWHQVPRRAHPVVETNNRYFNNLPEMAWQLLVRFSH